MAKDVNFEDGDPVDSHEPDGAYHSKYRRYATSVTNSVLTREARAATFKLVPPVDGSSHSRH